MNDHSIPSLVVKALKRTMAGEYSRELSAKVIAGQKRLAALGLKQGRPPGYGYRRLLVSASGEPKVQLLSGQRKSIQEDRVRLILGPEIEVNCIRGIFRMFTEEGKLPIQIANDLNQRSIPYDGVTRQGRYPQAINRILRNPKYMGCNRYGRITQRLGTKQRPQPKSMWTVVPDSWAPIVDHATSEKAQQRFASRTFFKRNEELLEELRTFLHEKGKLSERIIVEAPHLPSQGTYRRRFGTESQAFFLAGYEKAKVGIAEKRRHEGLCGMNSCRN